MFLIITNKYHQSTHPNALRVKSFVKALCNQNIAVSVLQGVHETEESLKGEFGEQIYFSPHKPVPDVNRSSNRIYKWLFRIRTGQQLNDFISVPTNLDLSSCTCILSTGPSFNTFVVAEQICLHNPKIKWIADYRDLWTNRNRVRRNHFSRKILNYLDQRVEKRINKRIDLITTVTKSMSWELDKLFPNKKIEIISNGIEDELISCNFNSPEKNKLIISYTGNLYINQDSNNVYLNKIDDLCSDNIAFRFVGTDFSGRYKLPRNVEILEWVGPSAFINELKEAHAFIHFSPKGASAMATTKIFSYLATGKPLILVDPEEGELLELTELFSEVHLVNNTDELEKTIQSLFSKLQNNSLIPQIKTDINPYSRKIQAEKLVNILNELKFI